MFAVGDGDQGFEHHLAPRDFSVDQRPELLVHRQENEIGEADAIDGGDEGDGDAATEQLGVGQVFHDVDQAEHCAEYAYGRRVAASGVPYLGAFALYGFIAFEIDGADFAQLRRRRAIDEQAQALAHKGIAFLAEIVFQLEQAFALGDHAPVVDTVYQRQPVVRRRHEDAAQHAQAVDEIGRPGLQQHGAKSAEHDDDERGRLQQRTDAAALNGLPQRDAGEGQRQAG